MDPNRPNLDLEELVARAREGDREAFNELAGRFLPRLKALIRFRLNEAVRPRLDAEDVLQETLLRVFRGIESFEWKGQGRFVGWLTTVAENTCRELVRRHMWNQRNGLYREVPLAQPIAGEDSVRELAELLSGHGPHPPTVLAREERLARLEKALDTLDPRQREVLILSLLKNVPTSEIAERFGMKSPAVCMLRSRALKKLRQAFGETESLHLPDRPLAAGVDEPRGDSEKPR